MYGDSKIFTKNIKKGSLTMKNEILKLISELTSENSNRSQKMLSGVDDYIHSKLVHEYNNTIDIIKRLEEIIK